MRVLSLFDGISCGMVALKRAGIPVSEYHACEIDKYAIAISQKNYPQIIRHGSVVDYHPDRSFDYLIGGSPCQGFSFAGKQLALDDPRSALFLEYVRILEECRKLNPDIKFLLENVNMKKEFLDVITEKLGVQPVKINSALVSAQNRVRWYWANFPITQPEDKRLVLRDIIENGAVDREKSYCIDANYYKGGNPQQYFEKGRRQLVSIHELPHSYVNGGVRDVEKFPTLRVCTSHNYKIKDESMWRKLTVKECERLQTLPDGYTEGVSNTQRYKALGNAWTVDVIAHILSCYKSTSETPSR